MIYKIDIENFNERSEIVKLLKESYLIEARLINFYEIPGLLEDEEKIRKSGETFYGYKSDGKLAGIISFKIDDSVLDIHRVAVHPVYFKRGIASIMVKEIETIGSPLSKIIVSTAKENIPACNLYGKLGFAKVGEKEVEEGLIISVFEKLVG
jgi:ribosomal protein S18 acetylase RimI-like enzyme